MHEEQVRCARSEASSFKSKSSRSKCRKVPYQVPNNPVIQPPANMITTVTPTQDSAIHSGPARPITNIWSHHQKTPPSNLSAFQSWNSYFSQRHSSSCDHSPSGSTNSCYGDTVDHQSHESSPVVANHEEYYNYWKPRAHCLFNSLDANPTSDDIYKAAYGSYYQHLAASATRTYGHIGVQAKIPNLYPSTYSRFTGTY